MMRPVKPKFCLRITRKKETDVQQRHLPYSSRKSNQTVPEEQCNNAAEIQKCLESYLSLDLDAMGLRD